MVKKFFIEENGKEKEVNFGDDVKVSRTMTYPGGITQEIKTSFKLDRSNYRDCIKKGLIKIKKYQNKKTIEPLTFPTAILIVSRRNHMSYDETKAFLEKLYSIRPMSALTTVLYHLAKYFDNKYDGHIKDCGVFYTINSECKIMALHCSSVKTWDTIMAFRKAEDLKEALEALKPLIKAIYGKQ